MDQWTPKLKYNILLGVSVERIPRAYYTKELREEAVKLVTEGGLSTQGYRLHSMSYEKGSYIRQAPQRWVGKPRGRLPGNGTRPV